jgi:hypothetical protein
MVYGDINPINKLRALFIILRLYTGKGKTPPGQGLEISGDVHEVIRWNF